MDASGAAIERLRLTMAEWCPRIGHTACLGVIENEDGVAVTKVRDGSPLCVYRTAQLRAMEELQRMTA